MPEHRREHSFHRAAQYLEALGAIEAPEAARPFSMVQDLLLRLTRQRGDVNVE
jgi:hypothetical protein